MKRIELFDAGVWDYQQEQEQPNFNRYTFFILPPHFSLKANENSMMNSAAASFISGFESVRTLEIAIAVSLMRGTNKKLSLFKHTSINFRSCILTSSDYS